MGLGLHGGGLAVTKFLAKAGAILTVTDLKNAKQLKASLKQLKGYKINYVLYANNYEETDEEHPVIEKFQNSRDALKVFKEGKVMSKGTTTSTGITHSYFANIFGPTQYRERHDEIAKNYFELFFKKDIFVGQFRTRLGIKGYEMKGPEEAAKELLKIISL
jgi:hypothetical protein